MLFAYTDQPGETTMKQYAGPLVLSAAMLGVIGGGAYAAAHAFAPVTHEPAKVVQVENAGQTVTSSPTSTTATAKPAPVKSTSTAKAKAPAPVQKRQAVVSEQPADPEPTTTPKKANVGTVVTNPDGSTSINIQPGQAPPPLPAKPAPSPSAP